MAEATESIGQRRLSRRLFLRGSALTVGSVAMGGLLAACAQQPPPAQTAAPAKPAESKPAESKPVGQPAATQPAPQSQPPATVAPTAGGKPITFVEGTDVTTLDPTLVSDTPTWTAINLLYDTLVTWDPNMKLVPLLAAKWATSDDRKTWTFDLRPGVKFSDGSPFNAEAVKYSVERTLKPETGSVVRAIFEGIVDKVEPGGENQVKITTKNPYPDLLTVLASPSAAMYSPSATEKYDVKEYGRNPVGTGPYMVKEWTTGERLVMVPNPSFWGEKPRTPQITYRPIPEAATRAALLRTGEADIVVKLPPEEIRNLESAPNVDVLRLDSMYQISFELHVEKDDPPLKDKRVRQALNYAVDKEAISKSILQDLGAPIRSPFGPGIDFRVEQEPYKYDPARAKQLLTEAGYPNGFKMELWSPQGRYLKDGEISEAVQGYLKAVGIDAGLRIWEWAPYTQAVRQDATRQAMMLGRATPGADFFVTRLFTKGAIGQFNSTGFTTEKTEDLIPKARSTFDESERAQLYREIQATVWDEAPWIFLYNQKALVGTRKDVQGFGMWSHEVMLLRDVAKS